MATDVAETTGPPESAAPVRPAPGRTAAPAEGTILLRPPKGWQPVRLVELWRYRELLWFLAWRDVKVRYKQTALGVAWAVLQPLFMMVLSTVIFGGLGKISSGDVPYPLFCLCALLPWQLFAYALTQASNSVVAEQNLVTKVYFPRVIIPLSSVLSGVVDFGIAFVLLLGMMGCYGVVPGWGVVTLPLFMLLALGAALAVGLWLSALNVQYRDFRYTIPFLTQFWFFATPVVYPSNLIPEKWRLLYGLNPMAGVVEGFRWALLGKAEAPGPIVWASAASVAVLLTGGLFYFRRMEKSFADVV
jgi:lipopolysaccharide transport system permease protein